MMLITLPVFMPIVQRLDIDMIWFGVLYLICMQLGLLLPPHGLLDDDERCRSAGVTMAHIFQAVVPYIAMSIVLLLIIIAFPAIATWLPNLWVSPAFLQDFGISQIIAGEIGYIGWRRNANNLSFPKIISGRIDGAAVDGAAGQDGDGDNDTGPLDCSMQGRIFL